MVDDILLAWEEEVRDIYYRDYENDIYECEDKDVLVDNFCSDLGLL